MVLGHSAGADIALTYALESSAHCVRLICVAGGRVHNDRDWRRVYELNRDGIGELLPPAAYRYNMHVNSTLTQNWREYCKALDLLQRIAALSTPGHYVLAERTLARTGHFSNSQHSHVVAPARSSHDTRVAIPSGTPE